MLLRDPRRAARSHAGYRTTPRATVAVAVLLALLATAGPISASTPETRLGNVRQLTFGGENAEGYWSPDGRSLVLQSTHGESECDQIFRMSPDAPGELHMVSTGRGRTTCAFYTADGERVIYSSTHTGSDACPPPPDRSMGYVWALYDSYEIFSARPDGSDLRRLTDNDVYDAEATVCAVDGSIIFTSTRDGDLELYRMNADGSDVKRLTETPGYDGGAFFSDDCSRIVWRASRFRNDEDLADYERLLERGLVRPSKLEIWVADADGGNARQVTYLDAASFAPYFFPGGERIIFSSNHGDPRGREFELWAVDVDGTDLERITWSPQFDGFPMFSPDGSRLVFASNRNQSSPGETNLFVADWVPAGDRAAAAAGGLPAADRYMADVRWLADDARGGRGVGTPGLDQAARWIAGRMQEVGLQPGLGKPGGASKSAGDYLQPFLVPVEVSAAESTALDVDGEPVAEDAFRALGFSADADAAAEVVFAGYGITSEEHDVDDYAGVDADGKIVLVRRFTPVDGVFADTDLQERFSSLRYKAWNARQHGAVGMLVVDLPAVAAGEDLPEEAPLPKLNVDARGDAGIPAAAVSREIGRRLIDRGGRVRLTVKLDIRREPSFNVVGRVAAGHPQPLDGTVIIGAHYDHLGMGGPLSLEPDKEEIHNGADDNASGVAALLAAAGELVERKSELRRDVWLLAFSAEEGGLLGSGTLVKTPPSALDIDAAVAMINMDMVGRLRDNRLTVLGGDSAEEWDQVVPAVCDSVRIECALGGDGYGPSDHTSFYAAGVPVLHLFSGTHHEYHRPSDDAHLINAAGGARVGLLAGQLALAVAARNEPLGYLALPQPVTDADTRSYGASLGTVPDYAGDPEGRPGVLLSGVRAGGAAEAAGVQRGDLLVGLSGREIRDIYDLVFILRNSKPGEETEIVVIRDGERVTLPATFGQRGRIR